jgi:uncharacterized protein GlcG (DUF336 family)
MPISCESISHDDAQKMLSAAEAKTLEVGIPYCIAVVDAAGELMAFTRQDGARRACIELSIGKAVTARLFNASTADLNAMAAPGAPLFGIAQINEGKVVLLGGGLPITHNGSVVGAIGASAGTAEQDIAVAQAGIASLDWLKQPTAAAT